jgi:hypothetical protein
VSGSIPLWKKEDRRLEFKSADALKDPEKIAREVVAMLNAEGGEIWVGLREEGGRAVAIEPLADPEVEERRLLDFLVDTIEPPVSEGEVSVGSVDEGNGTVLRIVVSPDQARKPYAFLRKGGRHFVIRVGDRIRPMARDEVFLRRPERNREALERAEAKVLEDRNSVLKAGTKLFWLRLEPATPVSLDIQNPLYEELLQDPQKTQNRLSGWNFSKFQYRPRVRKDKLVTDPEDLLAVEIRRDGGLLFSAPLEALYWKGEQNQIWPPVLLEYVVSAFRIARSVYEGHLQSRDAVVTDLVISGLKGWQLSPGIPERWQRPSRVFSEAEDFVLVQPLAFFFKEIEAEPDHCGYRLIERIYEAFGFRRESIPLFDPATGRLVLSE